MLFNETNTSSVAMNQSTPFYAMCIEHIVDHILSATEASHEAVAKPSSTYVHCGDNVFHTMLVTGEHSATEWPRTIEYNGILFRKAFQDGGDGRELDDHIKLEKSPDFALQTTITACYRSYENEAGMAYLYWTYHNLLMNQWMWANNERLLRVGPCALCSGVVLLVYHGEDHLGEIRLLPGEPKPFYTHYSNPDVQYQDPPRLFATLQDAADCLARLASKAADRTDPSIAA